MSVDIPVRAPSATSGAPVPSAPSRTAGSGTADAAPSTFGGADSSRAVASAAGRGGSAGEIIGEQACRSAPEGVGAGPSSHPCVTVRSMDHETAIRAASAAAEVIRERYGHTLDRVDKGGGDFAT